MRVFAERAASSRPSRRGDDVVARRSPRAPSTAAAAASFAGHLPIALLPSARPRWASAARAKSGRPAAIFPETRSTFEGLPYEPRPHAMPARCAATRTGAAASRWRARRRLVGRAQPAPARAARRRGAAVAGRARRAAQAAERHRAPHLPAHCSTAASSPAMSTSAISASARRCAGSRSRPDHGVVRGLRHEVLATGPHDRRDLQLHDAGRHRVLCLDRAGAKWPLRLASMSARTCRCTAPRAASCFSP